MGVTVRFMGTAAFEILSANGKRVLIDPYLDDNPVSPLKVADIDHLDLLLVTHGAVDHLGDAFALMRRIPGLTLVCGADVRGFLMKRGIESERLVAVPWGMMVEQAGIRVRPVYARHWSFIQDSDGAVFSSTPLGFIVYADDDIGIYHSGDSALYGDMKLYGELYHPRVGLINVGVPREHRGAAHGVDQYLTGEMTAREAAAAARWWDVEYAIPCHHDDPELPEIAEFRRILEADRKSNGKGPIPVILSPGEQFSI